MFRHTLNSLLLYEAIVTKSSEPLHFFVTKRVFISSLHYCFTTHLNLHIDTI